MRIAKEGYRVILVPAILTVFAAVLGWAWVAAVLALATSACAAFFRDPDRTPPPGEGLILSPADGKIVDIREVKDAASGATGMTVSIFMSPLDVHVNRAPVRGRVEDVRYQKGRFIAAYHDDASENNERNALTIIDPRGRKVELVQIAGIMARRIVCRVKRGDSLEAGERFGIIMFGSRVDVHFPPGSCVEVAEGQRVRGGETILARFDPSMNSGS
jgi:phosphatidylserine decarboxylase